MRRATWRRQVLYEGAALLAALGSLAFSGCATWKMHGVLVQPPKKLRVAVLPVHLDFRVPRLSRIETAPAELKARKLSKGELKKIAVRAMEGNLAWIRGRLEERLSHSYVYEVIGDSEVASALSRQGLGPGTDFWKIEPEAVKSLARELKADVVLKSNLEGYGTIKTSWLLALLGLDYAEGAATGWAVAAASGNVWAGIGAGAADALLDTAKWLGGAWIFNRIFIPVVLRGNLMSGSDGRCVASKVEPEISFELFVHNKALDKYPKTERKLRQTRLRVVAEKAVQDLGRYLEHRAFDNAGSAKWKLPLR